MTMPEHSPADDFDRPVHVPVLLRETLHNLKLEPGLVVVDGTVGAGGHSREIAKQIAPGGRLLAIDRDPMMLAHARRALEGATPAVATPDSATPTDGAAASINVQFHRQSYARFDKLLAELGWPPADRVLLDLGLSSDQLADRNRGFSFRSEGPLDLRFHPEEGVSAADWLAEVPEEELARVLAEYAEEPRAGMLAKYLCQARRRSPMRTSRQLADAVAASAMTRTSRDSKTHPATRVFQALRIVVNNELGQVSTFLSEGVRHGLASGGWCAIITFHSLEDRLVKHAFRESETWQQPTPKPVAASTAEQRLNPRSRTAQLRVARKT
jgi:16S rRNA (cytosine1402-N4)-methyltransferase